MSIFLIRHAQSLGNINGRAESHASIPLTEFGHLQAQHLKTVLPKAKRVFISPFLRTRSTADPILQRDQIEPEILNIQEFSYLSDSRCKNTTLEERKPWVDEYWMRREIDLITSEGAESFRQFYQRVEDLVHKLELLKPEYRDEHLLIFSHGQFLQLFKMISLEKRQLSAELMRDFRLEMFTHPIGNAEYFEY